MEIAPATSERPAKARIVVVEDDRSSRSALVALLRMSGFDALPAATISEGLRLLSEKPQFMILDLMLPDGSGGEILQRVREQKLPIHVVVTTGAIDWQAMLATAAQPPDRVFQKPVNYVELVEWLQRKSVQ